MEQLHPLVRLLQRGSQAVVCPATITAPVVQRCLPKQNRRLLGIGYMDTESGMPNRLFRDPELYVLG
jgi:hypothetical protein